jgi:FKBP-type peptidyl-prolyl cis-trans isomerase
MKNRDRIFALVMAVLFLVTSLSLSVAVIYNIATGNDEKSNEQAAANDLFSCQSMSAEGALPAPEVFKPEGDVTKLETTDLEPGTGEAAKDGDCLVMKYYGTLASDGTMFDENFTQPTGFAFKLGQGNVIKGWDQGLVGMKEGGVRRLVIPSDLAYGDQANGAIPANSDLVFVVKLLRIQK